MHKLKKFTRPIGAFLAVLMLMVSTCYQSASAAMIATEPLLQTGRPQAARDQLSQLMAREEIQNAFIAQGVDPREARLRIASLADFEIVQIADKIDDLRAGQGVFIFSLIIVGVIIAAFVVFNYTGVTKVFP
jgi:hypothetical protein